jgi:hypothetical protein
VDVRGEIPEMSTIPVEDVKKVLEDV